MNEELYQAGREVLAARPFSRLLGAELLEFTRTSTVLRVPITPELNQQHGFVHGRVISYLADNALNYVLGRRRPRHGGGPLARRAEIRARRKLIRGFAV